ncbi:hypothetical protein J7L85_03310, partial [candidate division WOR-3 bacterium]|nr:hypothetical protein [candidate division WOR-3 bacterium]
VMGGSLAAGWEPPGGVFPILSWVNPPAATDEQYQLFAEAGFTFASYTSELETAVAGKHGVLALYALGQHDPATPEGKARIDKGIKTAHKYPNCCGYLVRDEPNAKDFSLLGRIVAYLREHDPGMLALINLFPTYANERQLGTKTYREHVQRYLAEVKPDVLCFDNYPCIHEDGWRSDYYWNLEIISDEARKAGIPFWAFILSSSHGAYRIPTRADLCLQGFSDLAYGARGIYYFTYGRPRGYRSSIVDYEGKPTPELYPKVRRLNAILRGWGAYLDHGVPVYHVGELPRGTKALEPESPDNMVVSCEPGNCIIANLITAEGKRAVMIVNKDRHQRRSFRLRFKPQVKAVREVLPPRPPVPAAPKVPVELAPRVAVEGSFVAEVGPGFARLYQIEE